MRVLLLTYDDFANVAFEFTEALKSVGVDAFGMKYRPHPFNYYQELPIRESPMELAGLIRGFDHIIYLQSILLDTSAIPKDYKYIKIFLFVGDHEYRKDHKRVLQHYPKIRKVFYQTGDLAGKSKLPEEWLLPAINTDLIQTKWTPSTDFPITIGHLPRDPGHKGSGIINYVMYKLVQDKKLAPKFVYKYTENQQKDWPDHIERMDQCDVYIESQAYTLSSKPLGEFGVTALECCSLSKATITCFNSHKKYEHEFKNTSPIIPANSPEQLEHQLRTLLSLPIEEIHKIQQQSRDWVVKYHSRKATGARLKQLLEK